MLKLLPQNLQFDEEITAYKGIQSVENYELHTRHKDPFKFWKKKKCLQKTIPSPVFEPKTESLRKNPQKKIKRKGK